MTDHLTYAAYDAIDAVRFSNLKHMDSSAADYHYHRTNPVEETDAMLFGRAAHCATLEPDRFPVEYVLWDGGRRAGGAWAEFKAAHEGRTILKADDYARALALRDAVHAHPIASKWLAEAEAEVTVTWTDTVTGIACKARLDALGRCHVTELKTTATLDPRRFETLSANLFYPAQCAFHGRGVAGMDNPRVIAVESSPPHDVLAFRLTDDALAWGEQKCDDWLAHLSVCMETDTWPGRCAGEVELGIPAWCESELDNFGGLFGGGNDA